MTHPDPPNLPPFPLDAQFMNIDVAGQSFSDYPTWSLPFSLPVMESDQTNCPYREGRDMIARGFACEDVPADAYQALMDGGFRRSGRVFYQPVCQGCRACLPLRVPVQKFKPSRSQKRALRKNYDLKLSVGPPNPTSEKYDLYYRYLEKRHDGQQASDEESFIEFLYDSPTDTIELTYRDQQDNLIGVGLCDQTHQAISTMYFYFDPEHPKRSLGTFSALMEIQYARATNRQYYYFGYWIAEKENMAYKANYRPAEVLCTDSIWRPVEYVLNEGKTNT